MASNAQGIKAGRAFVTLATNDGPLRKGLAAASARLRTWAAGLSAVGTGLLAAGFSDVLKGLAGFAALGHAAKSFADAGSALQDMSQRTGFTVEQLSALDFAAGMSGSSMEELEAGIRKMQQQGVGSGLADLERFADELAGISDPGKRAARAMQIFGKAGTRLLPLMADGADGMRALMREAAEAGVVMSGTDAGAAERLGDAFDKLKRQLKALWVTVGAAVAPALSNLFADMAPGIASAIQWTRENAGLIVSFGKLSAVSVALGTATIGLGLAFKVAGLGITATLALLGASKAILVGLMSPIGLLGIGLAGATAAWVMFSREGQNTAGHFKTAWEGIVGNTMTAIQGITAALKAGDLGTAAKIGLKGLEVIFNEVVFALKSTWIEFTTFFVREWEKATTKAALLLEDPGNNLWDAIRVATAIVGEGLGIPGAAEAGGQVIFQNQQRRAGRPGARNILQDHNAELQRIDKERDARIAALRKEGDMAKAELAKMAGQAAGLQAVRFADAGRGLRQAVAEAPVVGGDGRQQGTFSAAGAQLVAARATAEAIAQKQLLMQEQAAAHLAVIARIQRKIEEDGLIADGIRLN